MSSNKSLKSNSEVITFYSYKGGNGRTMALSNVACLLAQRNPEDEILMLDWDLEAPGLHKFFFQDRFVNKHQEKIKKLSTDLESKPGVIDLFLELAKAIDKCNPKNDSEIIELLDKFNFDDFIISTQFDNLSLLNAGRFDERYSDKVNLFDWEKLFHKAPSLIRLFAQKLSQRFRYVLIDSRTGYTDISGICTMLMPEKLIVVFTPNHQSFTGIKELIMKASKYRSQSDDLRPLLIYPLPSRIEFSRDDLRADWRFGNDSLGITGYQKLFENTFKEVYGLRTCDLSDYFDEVQIQQSPNYAYGEEIAVISEHTKDSFSISKSYEIFTDWLVKDVLPWTDTKEDKKTQNDLEMAKESTNKGLDLLHQGHYKDSVASFKKSIAIRESMRDKRGMAGDYNNLGLVYSTLRDYNKALEYYKKALEIQLELNDKESVARSYDNIGLVYSNLGRNSEVITYYDKALEIRPEDTVTLSSKALILHKLGRYEEAIEWYDKALKINPEDTVTLSSKGVTLDVIGRYEEAIECYDKALKINPDDAITLSNKASALGRLRRYEEAIEWYDRTLKINPEDTVSLSGKGAALDALGRYKEAIEWYDRALEIDPQDVNTLSNKGVALMNLSKYEEAIEYYNKALEIDPQDWYTLSNKGVALKNLGKYEEAIEWYDRALKINPDDADTWDFRADTLTHLGRIDDASENRSKAINARGKTRSSHK